jgi:PHD/YefM family antitoxin component YafN of YafNO toxin-antitoxin module
MQKVIGVKELQRRLHSILDEVTQDNVPYVLIRDNQPEAALIPYKTFLRIWELQEDELLAEFERLIAQVTEQNAIYPDAEVEADVAMAVAETRRDSSSR